MSIIYIINVICAFRDVCSHGYNTISIYTGMYNVRVCASAFVTYGNVFLSVKMLFCHWFYWRDCCKENTRVTEPVLGRFDWVFKHIMTNRNTVRFLKFRKSLEYFECIFYSEITRSVVWIENEISRLPSKRALLLLVIIANAIKVPTRSEWPSAVLLILLYDVRFLYAFVSASPMQFTRRQSSDLN